MSLPSGTFTPENPSLFSDDNSNWTQAISRIGEQNVVKETVGLDLGKSSIKKHKKLRSDVWNDFEKYTYENGEEWAKCKICEKLFDGSSKKGTTHLRNHFKSCQNKKNEGGGSGSGDKPAEDSVMDLQLNRLDKSNEGGGSGSGDKPAEDSVMDLQLNRLDRVKLLIKQCYSAASLPESIEVADIINVYKEEKEKLRIYFEKLPCRLSLMIDTVGGGEFICFWVRFIDDDWKLKEKIISLKCIGGDPIMKILKNVLSEWGIDNNISYMILDGGSYDEVMSSNERENWFSKLFCMRDFYPVLITCSECIKDTERHMYSRMKLLFNYIRGKENFRSAIDRARSSGKNVTTGVIPTEQEFKNMGYRARFENALGLKEAFFELENMDIEFKSINLTKEEWDAVTTFYDLNVGTADEIFCGSYKTANMFFPWLCSTYWTSVELLKLKPFIDERGRFQYIEKGLHSVRDGMKCWYDDNSVLAVAAVLDPRFKMDVVEHWYKKIYGDESETRLAKFKDYLTSVYNEYAKGTNDFRSSVSGSEEKKSAVSYKMLDLSGKPCKFSHPELHLYLEDIKFPLIQDFNILDWWQSNTQNFPTLARLAHDFLSIQIRTSPDCRYLIAGMNALQRHDHNSESSDMVKEAFACTKQWLESEELE